MVDILPYIVVGFTRKNLRFINIGKRIDEIFSVFENYLNEVIDKNRRSPCTDENKLIYSLLDPKNGFDDEDVRDEFITMILGVSMQIVFRLSYVE